MVTDAASLVYVSLSLPSFSAFLTGRRRLVLAFRLSPRGHGTAETLGVCGVRKRGQRQRPWEGKKIETGVL